MRLLLSLSCLLLSLSGCAASIPEAVKQAFAKKFPGVTVRRWEMEGGDYEAAFRMSSRQMSAVFDGAGNWKETETAIPVSALPAGVLAYVSSRCNGKKIKEAAVIEKSDASKIYEAEVNGEDLLFDTAGKPLAGSD